MEYVPAYKEDTAGHIEKTKRKANPNLKHHVQVYALAEKYCIPAPKTLAAEQFEIECGLWWEHPEFVEALHEVYETTLDSDRGLRDQVVKTIEAHREIFDKGELKRVLRDTLVSYDLFMDSNKLDGYGDWAY